jgi:hypothetical protein
VGYENVCAATAAAPTTTPQATHANRFIRIDMAFSTFRSPIG